MSVLEHQWIIKIIDAIHAHDIEKLCIDTGIASTSIVKIVPLNRYEDITKKIQRDYIRKKKKINYEIK